MVFDVHTGSIQVTETPTYDNLPLRMNPYKRLKVVVSSYRQQVVVTDRRTTLWRRVPERIRRQTPPSRGGRHSQFTSYAILDIPSF